MPKTVENGSDPVTIVEVGPRDGLQNEAALVRVADKIAFIDRLSAAGCGRIEVSAFVSHKWIPQLADAEEVFAGITPRPGTRYSALVPNVRGLERAIASGVTDVAIFDVVIGKLDPVASVGDEAHCPPIAIDLLDGAASTVLDADRGGVA